jgi:hypothetical protein
MSLNNPEDFVREAIRLVESNDNSNFRLNANGGNSILIVCEPSKEFNYLQAINNLMTKDKYEIIDLNELLCEFVKANTPCLENNFELLKASIHQIFKIPVGEKGSDLFMLIVQKIVKSYQAKKVPVLINSGALYGSGIENIQIMENEMIMKASLPLIILYPATKETSIIQYPTSKENEKLMFLSKRPASKYRCMIID